MSNAERKNSVRNLYQIVGKNLFFIVVFNNLPTVLTRDFKNLNLKCSEFALKNIWFYYH